MATADQKIIVITGQGEKETALQAIGAGAYDFLGKPLDVSVTATDPSGTTKTATVQIQIAPTLVNP